MMQEDQRELPVAFWGGTGADQPAPAQDVVNAVPELTWTDIANQWAPSFEALGFEIHEALRNCMNTHSALLNKQMLTIEDVYRHLSAQVELVKNGTIVTEPSPVAKERQAQRAAKAAAIKAAADAWHEACRQRKEALRQWDDYVKAKKKELEDARGAS